MEQEGTPDDLYARPASTFTARFLGTPPMNVIPLSAMRNAATGEDLLLGVRPERVSLASPSSGVTARVEAAEYLGADTVLLCRIGEAAFAARVPGHPTVRTGETIGLVWPPEAEHLFDRDGRRIEATNQHGAARAVSL